MMFFLIVFLKSLFSHPGNKEIDYKVYVNKRSSSYTCGFSKLNFMGDLCVSVEEKASSKWAIMGFKKGNWNKAIYS